MKDRGRDLDKGGAIKGDSGFKNYTAAGIYRQEASNGIEVGRPLENI